MKTYILASLAVSVGVLAVACSASDPTQSGDEGLKQCPVSACGPQLGMPNYLCPDGVTVAGPTGQCISTKSDPTCHWQVVSCPADCTQQECGPEPMIASQICSDGGTAGPVCERVNGTCGWHITTCNDGPCSTTDCGPEPMVPTQICSDGGTAGPVCERQNGVCGWHITTCDSCSATDCGPEPMYVIQCPDGGSAAPVCEKVNGVCGWQAPSCQ